MFRGRADQAAWIIHFHLFTLHATVRSRTGLFRSNRSTTKRFFLVTLSTHFCFTVFAVSSRMHVFSSVPPSRRIQLWSPPFVCLFIRLFVRSLAGLVISRIVPVRFLITACSALRKYRPYGTINLREVRVKVQSQNCCTWRLKSSHHNSAAMVWVIFHNIWHIRQIGLLGYGGLDGTLSLAAS